MHRRDGFYFRIAVDSVVLPAPGFASARANARGLTLVNSMPRVSYTYYIARLFDDSMISGFFCYAHIPMRKRIGQSELPKVLKA